MFLCSYDIHLESWYLLFYSTKFYKRLNIHSQERRARGDIFEVFKWVKGINNNIYICKYIYIYIYIYYIYIYISFLQVHLAWHHICCHPLVTGATAGVVSSPVIELHSFLVMVTSDSTTVITP